LSREEHNTVMAGQIAWPYVECALPSIVDFFGNVSELDRTLEWDDVLDGDLMPFFEKNRD